MGDPARCLLLIFLFGLSTMARRRIRTLSALPLCVVLGGILVALPGARAETLETAVLEAINHHPGVSAALAARDAAIESRNEAFSSFFPQLRASAAVGRVYGDNSTSRGLSTTRGAGYSGLAEASLTATQLLFDANATRNRLEAAQARRVSANSAVVDARETVALRAVQAYLAILRARDVLDLARTHRKKIDDYVHKIDARVKQGAADESELSQARDIALTMDGALAGYQGDLETAMAMYREAVGRDPEEPMTAPDLAEKDLPPSVDSALEAALKTHPMLRAASFQTEAAAHETDAEKSALLPDLTAEASWYRKDLADEIGGEATDARGLVRMNWDFATGGADLARVRRRSHEYAQTKAQQDETARQIERDVRRAWVEVETARKQATVARSRTGLNESLLKTYQTQFEGAKITMLQILQAENALFGTQAGGIDAHWRTVAAGYGLLAGMGSLQTSMNITGAKNDPDLGRKPRAPHSAAQ
ncbi:MAG TPA: TolC family protein [Alphaproteobacteria bacterium]|nr:TolC family protein [Alphaproteobacteria bacterium]